MLLYSCASKPQPKPDKELAKKSFIQLEKDILGTESQAFGTIDQVLNDADRSLDNLIVLDQKGWVRVSEKRDFDGSVSPDEARERLLKILRNKAIKKKVGTEVEIVSLLSDVMVGGGQEVFEESVWSGFFRSTVSGIIAEEKYTDEIVPSSSGLQVTMILDAFVIPVEGDRDPSFYLDAKLKSNMLKNGDELNITLTSSKDSYVYIINLMSDNNAMLIYPNKYMENNFINANTELTIPNESLRNKIRLRVGLLPDQSFSSESIYVVCTKDKVPMLHNFPKVGKELKIISNSSDSFFELQKWLANIPLNQRAEKALIYYVSK